SPLHVVLPTPHQGRGREVRHPRPGGVGGGRDFVAGAQRAAACGTAPRRLESAPLPPNLKTQCPPLIATGIVGSGRARVMPRSAGASPCLGAARPCKATTLPDTTIPPPRATLCRGSGHRTTLREKAARRRQPKRRLHSAT